MLTWRCSQGVDKCDKGDLFYGALNIILVNWPDPWPVLSVWI